jgi:hypothetical protein
MSLKDFFKDFDWKNPTLEGYKQAFLKPRPINLFPLRRKDKIENGYMLASFSTSFGSIIFLSLPTSMPR